MNNPKGISTVFNFAFGIYKALEARIDQNLVQKFGERDWATPIADLNFFPLRFEEAMRNQERYVTELFDWIFTSKEYTNYTLSISPLHLNYMACFVSQIADIPFEKARGYIQELMDDTSIPAVVTEHIKACSANNSIDAEVRYGKRVVWYALARHFKPKTIIETGIDKGLGSVAMCLALIKNWEEGSPGYYFGLDINPQAGYLIQKPFSEIGRVLVGDSIESIQKFPDPIDFLICDSDHTIGYETREYQTAESKLSPRALIISDTASYDGSLFDYARATGRDFLYCPEYAEKHWYPGDGVGVAWRRGIAR